MSSEFGFQKLQKNQKFSSKKTSAASRPIFFKIKRQTLQKNSALRADFFQKKTSFRFILKEKLQKKTLTLLSLA